MYHYKIKNSNLTFKSRIRLLKYEEFHLILLLNQQLELL